MYTCILSADVEVWEGRDLFFNLKSSWNISGGLCWKTLSHSCPVVTTSVSLRDQSLSNITYSRQDTQLEANIIETCWDKCGTDWILSQNPNWLRSTCTLHNRPVLSLCFRLSVARFFTPATDSHDSRNCLILDLSSRNRTGQLAHCLMDATNNQPPQVLRSSL